MSLSVELSKLRDQLSECFNKSELNNLCFDLDIKHEDLPAQTLTGIARELIAYCLRHNNLDDLIERCRQLRPLVNWPDVQELVVEEGSVTHTTLAAPFQAPPRLRKFVGREALLQEVGEALLAGGNICTLQGMGGVGKTAVATHLAYELRPSFRDGVLWANLDNAFQDGEVRVPVIMSILGTFAAALGRDVQGESNVQARSRILRETVAGKRALLVLDNAANSESVRYLLPPSTGKCAVLITTRNKRMLDSEALSFDIDPLPASESLVFLQSFVGYERVDQERSGAERILQLLGGLPLAIKVVATDLADTQSLTLTEYYELLANERTRLANLTDWEDTSKDVRSSFELSYKRLSLRLSRLFDQLAVFSKGSEFCPEAIAAILDKPLVQVKKEMGQLQELSLVEPGAARDDQPRACYRLHPLLSVFADEKLGELPEEVAGRYVDYYLSLACRYAKADPEAWDLLEQALPNLLLAIDRAAIKQDTRALVQFEEALLHDSLFLNVRAYYKEAIGLFTQSLAAQETTQEQENQPRTRNKLAYFYLRTGQYQLANSHAEAACELASACQNIEQKADSYRYLAFIADSLGEKEQTLAYFDQELIMRRRLGDRSRLTSCLYNLATLLLVFGRYGEAEDLLDEAAAEYGELDDQRGIASCKTSRGTIHLYRGAYENAQEAFNEALVWSEAINDRERVAVNLHNRGIVEGYCENFTASLASLEKALSLYQSIDCQSLEALAICAIAEVHISLGGYKEAVRHLQVAGKLVEETKDKEILVQYLNPLGASHYVQGAHAEALQTYSQMENLARESSAVYFLVQSQLGLAKVYAALGSKEDLEKARCYAQEALEACQRLQLAGCEPCAHAYLAKAYLACGQPEAALTYAQESLHLLNRQQFVHGPEVEIYLYAVETFARCGQEGERLRILREANKLIEKGVGKISGEEQKQQYLEISYNLAIAAMWEKAHMGTSR